MDDTNGHASQGLQRSILKGRRVGATEEEIVPLAPSYDTDLLDANSDQNDVTTEAAPPSVQVHHNGVVGDDLHMDQSGDHSDDVEKRCGYWSCHPDVLQTCNNPKALLGFLCCLSLAQGFVVNGINNVNTSSVERRFQLPSSKVGMISSSYDFSAAILGIFISYMGSGRQKAKWLTMASVAMAIGSFIMAMPHFFTGRYEWGQDVLLTCSDKDNRPSCEADSGLQSYLYVFILGQLLHGVGGTTLYTVGVSLIDDSVNASSSPMYIGIMYVFASLGPALGYIVGGQFLNIYVDFDTVPMSDVRISPADPRWVGAWWLGFLIASGLFLLSAIPISLYGAELPTAEHVRKTRVSQMHGQDGHSSTLDSMETKRLKNLLQLPAEMFKLLRVPPFLFTTLAGATEGLILTGFATFMPKFIQNQFGVPAGWAAMLTGFMVVPGAAGGQFMGGYLCKRLKLKVKGCIRVEIICCTLVLLTIASVWLQCSPGHVAGVSTNYSNSSDSLPSLTATCNTRCNCLTELYEPVCDSSGVQYFSPCHAGCSQEIPDKQAYNSCSCVVPSPGQNVTMVTVGKCKTNCKSLYIFLPLTFVTIFLLFVPSSPDVTATLRCIHPSQRTLGLGLKSFIIRLLGTVPGPILFGAIIDGTCLLWRDKCDKRASCWIYDNHMLSQNFFIMTVCFKLVTITFLILAHQLYRPPTEQAVLYSGNGEQTSGVTILEDSDRTLLG